MMGSFFFVSSEVEFQEATKKGAVVLATLMELDKVSQNDIIYRFEEGEQLAASLVGKSIRFGADWFGKHILKKNPVIGKVLNAWKVGKKIKGKVLISAKEFVDKIKSGMKFLFSVGGVAQFGETVKKAGRTCTRLWYAICTHLQMLPNDPKGAGFPSAKMHKVIEINESVIVTDYNLRVCDGETCKILSHIKNEFEEAKRIADEMEEEAINMAVIKTIAGIQRAIAKEPWQFIEESED